MNKAFDWGTVVSVRTQVLAEDENSFHNTEAIPCTDCFDEVRQEARDPKCPTCLGNGWIERDNDTGRITQGYRPLLLMRAHISNTNEQFQRTQHGYVDNDKITAWVEFNNTLLRDGDLIAEIVPDNFETPGLVRKVIQKYEVVSNRTPDFTPGAPTLDNLSAQEVVLSKVDKDQIEYRIDMGEGQRGQDIGFER